MKGIQSSSDKIGKIEFAKLKRNAEIIERELNWFKSVLDKRIHDYFNQDSAEDPEEVPVPVFNEANTWYAQFIQHGGFSPDERIILMLALAPEIRPQVLDIFFARNQMFDRGFTEFGGIQGQRHGGFIPTIQTALFILAGDDMAPHLSARAFFESDHPFQREGILDLDINMNSSEPFTSTPLRLSHDAFSLFTRGRDSEPEYTMDFPAKKLETLLEWEDLVLSQRTLDELSELMAWLEHGEKLLQEWEVKKHIRPGYRTLFYGPPGTGKTLTASLLGKISGRTVYRIDLSQLVSKYIGETEKNLERVFKQAEKKNWILFFDEADSLFGKRTEIVDAHDRYANQGTSYLLQRLEDCPNLVILASNLRANLDDAFTRRFQSMIYFPMPEREERLRLWEQAFGPLSVLDEEIDLHAVANRYEIAGGPIVNVIRYCSLMVLRNGSDQISNDDLVAGIRREYSKEGRFL